MKETRGTPADPLEGLAPPGAPPELRARVLEASRAALLAGPAPRDRWSLLFASRPLRLAWAASVLLLLAGHALLVRPAPPRTDAAAELAAIRSLPRIDPDARSLGASPDAPGRPAPPPRHDPPKENRT
jgi:hypothetical protein